MLLAKTFCLLLHAASTLLGPDDPERARVRLSDGVDIEYLLHAPATSGRDFESLVVLPPGDEGEAMAREALGRYWAKEAQSRGWILAAPISPAGASYFSRRPDAAWAVADDVARRHRIKGGKHHLAGVSNGGSDALTVGLLSPARFRSITTLPGLLGSDLKDEDLVNARSIGVLMLVGEQDAAWRPGVDQAVARLRQAGLKAELDVIEGSGHVLSIAPARLFDLITDAAAPKGAPMTPDTTGPDTTRLARSDVDRVLTDFHDAASKADMARYFSLFTDDFVFFGTDASERWPLAQFRDFCEPIFAKGRGWTYSTLERHIFLSPGGDAAWFDERLANEKYGECRGTGVLIRRPEGWKLSQYHLVIPVPNDFALQVVEAARRLKTIQPPATEPPK
ncbi:MAG: nuclear transport factor 2 family protein [Phycisphaerae bacterium]|jgi:ketosteroid isomerase-like protein